MSVNWTKFDKALDLEGYKKDVKEAADNKRQYDEVPCGKYEVKIAKMELKVSKKGDPMLSVQFKIVSGKLKNQNIFMNQVCSQPFQTHICNEFLRSLGTSINIEFNGYESYSEMISDVFQAVEDEGLEYALDYSGNDKGFKTFEITEVFES